MPGCVNVLCTADVCLLMYCVTVRLPHGDLIGRLGHELPFLSSPKASQQYSSHQCSSQQQQQCRAAYGACQPTKLRS